MGDQHSAVFAGTDVGDVVRTDRPAASVVDLLTSVGWRVATIAGVRDEAGFHAEIAAALGFPAHYGANLDALWDCLADLPEPTALVWQDWGNLAVGEPRQWARLVEVLRARTGESPTFAVVLDG